MLSFDHYLKETGASYYECYSVCVSFFHGICFSTDKFVLIKYFLAVAAALDYVACFIKCVVLHIIAMRLCMGTIPNMGNMLL